MTMIPLVEARSVQVDYPHETGVLRLYDEGVSVTVKDGDFTAILGGSGWGKSTLVNIILGLEKATAGAVSFRGEDVTRKSFLKRRDLVKTAAVFQRPTALPQLTVSQNLTLALSLAGVPKRVRRERVEESLERALAVRPELLVIDEPTADLDSSASTLLLPLLRGLSNDHQISILITTAQPRCAAEAHHIVRLRPPLFLTSENQVTGN